MGAKVIIKVNGTLETYEDVDLSAGVRIEDIGGTEEWDLTTVDDSPDTFVDPHVGARPDDR